VEHTDRPRTSLIGGLAVLIVASQALNHPPAAVDRGGEVGQCLALGGARLMLAGGALGFARLSIAVSVKGRRLPPPPASAWAAEACLAPRAPAGTRAWPSPAGRARRPTEQLRPSG
jgi:hypothetical protein